jgi:phage-related protein
MAEWTVQYYVTATGNSPVTDFIDSLDDTAQAKVINTVRLLKEYNVRLGGSHAKKLTGTDLWELRILGSDSIRVFYVAVEQQSFLLLHGFKKKTFTTPKKELKLAVDRLKEYRSRI